jgi:hypothetical protein
MTNKGMDFSITAAGVDVTNYVTSYRRSMNICTGVGQLELTLDRNCPVVINPWSEVIPTEEGVQRGIFYVGDIDWSAEAGTETLTCTDGSKKLQDYFVAERYTISYQSNSKWWIKKFLGEAHVSYNFTTLTTGNLVAKDSVLGLASAYEIVTPLLQQNGWYMYFDSTGVAQIVDLILDTDNVVEQFHEDEIINITTLKHDKMLRNRAVVWGKYSADSGRWVFATMHQHTQWNYDDDDLRTTVVGDSNIPDAASAYGIASQLLREFTQINYEKMFTTPGSPNINLGDAIYISSPIYSGISLVTQLVIELNPSGYTTSVTVDYRCPRLFAYYFSGYIYAGTWGGGVYRKQLDGAIWANFSTGLEDLYIKDLYVANGNFVCVASDGYAYIRDITKTRWQKFTPTCNFVDLEDGTIYLAPNVTAVACTIDKQTSEVFIAYNLVGVSGKFKSWIVRLWINGKNYGAHAHRAFQLLTQFNNNFNVVDLDDNGKDIQAVVSSHIREDFIYRNPEIAETECINTTVHFANYSEHVYTKTAADTYTSFVSDFKNVYGLGPSNKAIRCNVVTDVIDTQLLLAGSNPQQIHLLDNDTIVYRGTNSIVKHDFNTNTNTEIFIYPAVENIRWGTAYDVFGDVYYTKTVSVSSAILVHNKHVIYLETVAYNYPFLWGPPGWYSPEYKPYELTNYHEIYAVILDSTGAEISRTKLWETHDSIPEYTTIDPVNLKHSVLGLYTPESYVKVTKIVNEKVIVQGLIVFADSPGIDIYFSEVYLFGVMADSGTLFFKRAYASNKGMLIGDYVAPTVDVINPDGDADAFFAKINTPNYQVSAASGNVTGAYYRSPEFKRVSSQSQAFGIDYSKNAYDYKTNFTLTTLPNAVANYNWEYMTHMDDIQNCVYVCVSGGNELIGYEVYDPTREYPIVASGGVPIFGAIVAGTYYKPYFQGDKIICDHVLRNDLHIVTENRTISQDSFLITSAHPVYQIINTKGGIGHLLMTMNRELSVDSSSITGLPVGAFTILPAGELGSKGLFQFNYPSLDYFDGISRTNEITSLRFFDEGYTILGMVANVGKYAYWAEADDALGTSRLYRILTSGFETSTPEEIFSASERFTAVEATNWFTPSQYLFVGTSGYPPKFWQRDYDAALITDFVEQSVGLPNAPITILRADDML